MGRTTEASGDQRANDPERLRIYQHIIADLSRLASTDPDFDDFLVNVVHQVGRAVEIDRIKVLRYRPERGDLLVEAGIGWNEGVVGHATLPIGLSSPPGRAIQTGEVSVIEDFPSASGYKRSGLLAEHEIVSLINAPIQVEGRCWGVLEADSREERSFSDDTIRFMATVAHLVGATVQRKQFEARVVDAEAETARELGRREVLLREMQHRVKNNFQVIISMMMIQKSRSGDRPAGEVLQDLADRVTAIALAHDQLDPRQGLRDVDVRQYLGALCRQMEDAVDGIRIDCDLDSIAVPIDEAVPLGLLVNELVTNAIKHAFDDAGTVRIEFKVGTGNEESMLAVIDDGKGMGPPRPGSSGTRLIESLARQVRGRVVREQPERGTAVRVFFPPAARTSAS